MENHNNIPIKTLHFCDGIIEIFEKDDHPDDENETKEKQVVDEKLMTWSTWTKHKADQYGKMVLTALDFAGEKLADALGISSPKYSYEINHFKKELESKAIEEKIAQENTWKIDEKPLLQPITNPPSRLNSNQI